ncbi:probable GH family 25 lysozyme 2 [Dysidea avara]|uniref:probable GH family 25 lysozyme 2 n=1 Tax=Dysidea avara TaxID=196820 RepID=UPI00331AFD15
MLLAVCVVFLLGLRLSEATKGIDVSQLVYPSDFKCLKEAGYDFVIVRAYQSLGHPDSNAIHTIANAREAGFQYIDVYLFPCPKCSKSASEQVSEMVDALSGESYGQIWLDIEGSVYWHSSNADNQKFFEDLLSAAGRHKPTGVYASEYQWSSIMGLNYTGGYSHQLWYAHYDDDPSFSDFSPFGGWRRPSMKQYAGDKTQCGVGVDLNYY